jgi:superfamily II DNA or RNA helicase
MEIRVENSNIIIKDANERFIEDLSKRLSYKDKSIEYQIRKMESNPFQKNSPYLSKLKKQLYGNLVKQTNDNEHVIPSGFYHLIKNIESIEDNRVETGDSISLPWENKPFNLREYQEEAVSEIENTWRGTVNFATGLGKTLTAVHAIRRIKRKTLVVCPGVSIADNFYEELVKAFGKHRVGYFGNGKKKINDITVAIAGSVNNHIQKFKDNNLGLVIFDEVHHLAASTYQKD